jgi:hypothetical protein
LLQILASRQSVQLCESLTTMASKLHPSRRSGILCTMDVVDKKICLNDEAPSKNAARIVNFTASLAHGQVDDAYLHKTTEFLSVCIKLCLAY